MPIKSIFVALVRARFAFGGHFREVFRNRYIPGFCTWPFLAECVFGQTALSLRARVVQGYDADSPKSFALAARAVRENEAFGPPFAHPNPKASDKLVVENDSSPWRLFEGADRDVSQPHLSHHCLSRRPRSGIPACFAAILRLTEISTAPKT